MLSVKLHKKHTAYSAAKKEAEARGETYREPTADERYVGKFSSLRGGQQGKHLVGGGLNRLVNRNRYDGYIVEGIKDMLAMRNFARGLRTACVGVAPPPEAMPSLAATCSSA